MNLASFVYLLSQVLMAFFTWATLSLLAKNFESSSVGEYSLVLAYITPLILLFSLQMRNHYLASENQDISKYFSLRIISLLPIFIVSLLLVNLDVVSQVLWGVLLLKLGDYFFELPFSYEQKHGKLLRASYINAVRLTLVYSLLFFCFFKYKELGHPFIVAGILSLLISAVYTFLKGISFKPNFDSNLFKSLIPLGVAASLLALSISVPKIFLDQFASLEEVASFSVIFTFYSVWQLLFNNYFNGMLHRLKKISRKKVVLLPLSVFFFASLFFLKFDTFIYRALFGANFVSCVEYTPHLLLSILLSFFSSYFYYMYIADQKFSLHFKVNFLSLSLHTLVGFFCIRYWGIQGAFIAWISAQLFQILYYWWNSRVR